MNRTTISRWMLALLLANPLMIVAMQGDQAQPVDQQNPQPVADAQPVAQQEVQEADCRICLGDPSDDDFSGFRRLVCGHQYCRGCLTDRINNGFEEWRDLENHLRCPREFCPHGENCNNGRNCPERIRCPHIMNAVDIRNVTQDDAQVARYNTILTDRFINANPNFRRCPTAGCEVIYEFDRAVRTIQCERGCHQEYCADCGLPHPQGAECGVVPNNNNANDEWIRANTRPCPNCRANIEKNAGCNHMTCRACQFEFCWFHLRAWNEDCRRGHWFNDHPELEAEAAQAAQALRGVAEPEPAQRPAEQPVPGIAGDDLTPEELADIARQFAQLEQNNHGQNRPNPNGPNDPNPNDPHGPNGGGPNDPNPRGRRNGRGPNDPNPNQGNGAQYRRAQPKPSNASAIIGVGLIVAAVSATAYGCYKLYHYLIQPKPDAKKDLKAALAELHKEATRGKNVAISGVYMKGAIKAFYLKQVKAGSFGALTHENMVMLTARVDALENACSTQRGIDEEYAVFMRCVSDLIVQANQSSSAKASADKSSSDAAKQPQAVPDATKQPQVKTTSVPAKAVTSKVPKHVNRRGRLVKKVR